MLVPQPLIFTNCAEDYKGLHPRGPKGDRQGQADAVWLRTADRAQAVETRRGVPDSELYQASER